MIARFLIRVLGTACLLGFAWVAATYHVPVWLGFGLFFGTFVFGGLCLSDSRVEDDDWWRRGWQKPEPPPVPVLERDREELVHAD